SLAPIRQSIQQVQLLGLTQGVVEVCQTFNPIGIGRHIGANRPAIRPHATKCLAYANNRPRLPLRLTLALFFSRSFGTITSNHFFKRLMPFLIRLPMLVAMAHRAQRCLSAYPVDRLPI